MSDTEDCDQGDEELQFDDDAVFASDGEEIVFFEEDVEDSEEIVKIQDKEIKKKKMVPIMNPYEKANIIAKRVEQIEKKGYLSTLDKYVLDKGITSTEEIVNLEFDQGKLPPYYIQRKKGEFYELWKHSDFEYFPR